jgi:hypothetical protein
MLNVHVVHGQKNREVCLSVLYFLVDIKNACPIVHSFRRCMRSTWTKVSLPTNWVLAIIIIHGPLERVQFFFENGIVKQSLGWISHALLLQVCKHVHHVWAALWVIFLLLYFFERGKQRAERPHSRRKQKLHRSSPSSCLAKQGSKNGSPEARSTRLTFRN